MAGFLFLNLRVTTATSGAIGVGISIEMPEAMGGKPPLNEVLKPESKVKLVEHDA